MIPLKDDIVSSSFPFINTLLIAINALAFLYELSLGPGQNLFMVQYAAVPEKVVSSGALGWMSIMASMFLHAGWAHFLGNMLYLYIFGDNVEDALGHFKYLVFYLLCGFGAAWAHIFTDPGSAVPMVGASGAIAGVLGAYFLLYPQGQGLDVSLLRFLRQDNQDPGPGGAGFLDHPAVSAGLGQFAVEGAGRRRGLVRPHRRVRMRHGPDIRDGRMEKTAELCCKNRCFLG